jgi:hypothetical protein
LPKVLPNPNLSKKEIIASNHYLKKVVQAAAKHSTNHFENTQTMSPNRSSAFQTLNAMGT